MASPRLEALVALLLLLLLQPPPMLLRASARAELDRSQEEELGRLVAALDARRHAFHLLELARQKQRGVLLDDLPERPSVIDALQRTAAEDPLGYVRELDRQRLLPYLEYEPRHRHYSPEDELRARLYNREQLKPPLPDYPETQYAELERARQQQQQQHQNHRHLGQEDQQVYQQRREPPFTYSFERAQAADDDKQQLPFAYRPNDPRYYDDRSSVVAEPADVGEEEEEEEEDEVDEEKEVNEEKEGEEEEVAVEQSTRRPGIELQRLVEEEPAKSEPVEVRNMLPEPQRRAELQPIIVKLERNRDIDAYFTWLVAVGSGVVVFALVITTLTWCRFQREAKAAADVEYPAYGVTGPNKDISPSGDQRLAQSAQMYHFQHQKQQIIAMEKASTNRDPGSVSDAESEEENEEGDYTVYECPGLAPTGEMEVKNPLFHDEPTPATPKAKNGDV